MHPPPLQLGSIKNLRKVFDVGGGGGQKFKFWLRDSIVRGEKLRNFAEGVGGEEDHRILKENLKLHNPSMV